MEYRIKVMEKNNGDKEYYPQFKDEEHFAYHLKLALSPFVFIVCLFRLNFSFLFTDYFWANISREKDISQCQRRGDFILTEHGDVICMTEDGAKLAIKKHYEQYIADKNKEEEVKNKMEEIKKRERLQKNKTTYYLTVNNPI